MSARLIQVLTSLHIGDGAHIGVVDLPVARERHTGWPFVPGASLKGALRARARREGCPTKDIAYIFGPEPGEALFRAAAQFGDAVLLALPVRTFHNTFSLLVSPLSLARFAQHVPSAPAIPESASPESLLVGTSFDLKVPGKEQAVLEDLCFLQKRDARVDAWISHLREGWLGDEAPLAHLTVVHDDVFAHAAHAWLPVRTRNAIDPSTGVVSNRALFSVEYMPAETLLWTLIDGDQDILPLDGDAFVLGGHNSTGSGRVALWRERT